MRTFEYENITLTLKEIAEMSGVRKASVLRRLNSLGIPFETDKRNGGIVRCYKTELLPEPFKTAILANSRKQLQAHIDAEIPQHPNTEPEQCESVDDDVLLASLSHEKRIRVIRFIELIRRLEGVSGYALLQALREWNKEYPDMHISLSTFYKYRNAYRKRGLRGLIPLYGSMKGRRHAFERLETLGAGIADEVFMAFCEAYLQQSKPSAEVCRDIARGKYIELVQKGRCAEMPSEEVVPSTKTFLRRLRAEYTVDAIKYRREGPKAHRDTLPKANRIHNQFAGEFLFSDNMTCNLLVQVPGIKKPIRPILTVLSDSRTGMILSRHYTYGGAPSSSTHIEMVQEVIAGHGKPRALYLDNGPDYSSSAFTEAKCTDEIAPLLSMVGIEVKYAIEYNPETKICERDFSDIQGWVEPMLPGFVGNNQVNRPKEKLKREEKQGRILTIEQFEALYDKALFGYFLRKKRYNSKRTNKGESMYDAWQRHIAEHPMPQLSEQAAKFLNYRPLGIKTVDNTGIRIPRENGKYWFHSALRQYNGQKVAVYWNPNDLTDALVFKPGTFEVICKARVDTLETVFNAQTEEEKDKLSEVQKYKASVLKVERCATEHIREMNSDEAIKLMALALNGDTMGTPVRASDIDRYMGRMVTHDVHDEKTGKLLVRLGVKVTPEIVALVQLANIRHVFIQLPEGNELQYSKADREMQIVREVDKRAEEEVTVLLPPALYRREEHLGDTPLKDRLNPLFYE